MSQVDMRTEASLDTYETPQWLVAEVKAFFGGDITYDPCTSRLNPTGALYYSTPAEDGLRSDWSRTDGGGVYVNSPYGRALKDWTAKCCYESMLNGVEILQLAPARFGSGWFKAMAVVCDELGVFNKRLAFTLDGKPVTDKKGRPTTAQFDTCLVYYGPRGDAFRKHFAKHLTYWKLLG